MKFKAPEYRSFTVIAQDPGVTGSDGNIATTQLRLPVERLAPGPKGSRVHVVDFDSSTNTLYKPLAKGLAKDTFADASDDELLNNPHFHCQNAYAIVMNTLLQFEAALGRHVEWGFASQAHQIKVIPHAFAEANAFYSRRDEALAFGYFNSADETVCTSLSHDVVAHETTHAVLDGMRNQYTRPSSPQQAAFHEGFADIVALLSVLANRSLVEIFLPKSKGGSQGSIPVALLQDKDNIKQSVLFGLAEQMGKALYPMGRDALRKSSELPANKSYLQWTTEPHALGEVLVAAVINTFLDIWHTRIFPKGQQGTRLFDRYRVAEQGSRAASHLLNICIRAIDYMPPVHTCFGDFLSAMYTADCELCADDSKYGYRASLLKNFADYGIEPASHRSSEDGFWSKPPETLRYGQVHLESLKSDPNAVYRFLWENHKALNLYDNAFTRVQSVRPVHRVGPDRFFLNETVAEYFQILQVRVADFLRLGMVPPVNLPKDYKLSLYGGGTLIFDEYGHLKYHISNRVKSPRQGQRIDRLVQQGMLERQPARRFAAMHLARAMGSEYVREEAHA